LWALAIALVIPNVVMTKYREDGYGSAQCVTEWPFPTITDVETDFEAECIHVTNYESEASTPFFRWTYFLYRILKTP